MPDLKPCPFCREYPSAEVSHGTDLRETTYFIRCKNCQFDYGRAFRCELLSTAVDNWNCRGTEPNIQELKDWAASIAALDVTRVMAGDRSSIHRWLADAQILARKVMGHD